MRLELKFRFLPPITTRLVHSGRVLEYKRISTNMANDPNPVEPCKGWRDTCSFCDKRFGKWKEVGNDEDEDGSEITLTKPSAYMFAYQTKQGKEVVSIGIHSPGKRHNGVDAVWKELRNRIANKSYKETKSTIHFRSCTLGQIDGKDFCVLYAHWFNSGVLPRLASQWPGIDILQNCEFLTLSATSNKWIYPTKNQFWKQQKTNPMPKAVKQCKGWKETCSFCDVHLSPWISSDECIEKNMAPNSPGYLLLAGNDGSKRETVYILNSYSIKKDIEYRVSDVRRHLHSDCKCIPADKSKTVEVRWILEGEKKVDNTSYLLVLAHWLNNGTLPVIIKKCLIYDKPFSDNLLSEDSRFIFREKDKKWCYVPEEEELPKSKNYVPKHKNRNKHQFKMDESDLFE